jgi:hypothetical protein
MVGPLFAQECQFRVEEVEDTTGMAGNTKITSMQVVLGGKEEELEEREEREEREEKEEKGEKGEKGENTEEQEALKVKEQGGEGNNISMEDMMMAEQEINKVDPINSQNEEEIVPNPEEPENSPEALEENPALEETPMADEQLSEPQIRSDRMEEEQSTKNEMQEKQPPKSTDRTPVKTPIQDLSPGKRLDLEIAELQQLVRPAMLYNHNSVLIGETIEEMDLGGNYFVKRRKGERTPTSGKKRLRDQECCICYSRPI